MEYTPKNFALPEMEGLSKESIEGHLGLYVGYVKNFNALTTLAGELMKDAEKNGLAVAELMRRRSFEFDGMRLHEYYFAQLVGGAAAPDESSTLHAAVVAQYGDMQHLLQEVRTVAATRGPGWAILYFDPEAKQFLVGWSEQQHQGHFVTLPIILALDVWEHAFIQDYGGAGRPKYIEAFFKNLNWSVLETRFAGISK